MAGARLAFALLVAVHRVAAQTAPTVFEGVGPLTAQASGGQLLTFTGSFPANLHTRAWSAGACRQRSGNRQRVALACRI